MSALALEMLKISKRFDATQALDRVSVALHKGEVHADPCTPASELPVAAKQAVEIATDLRGVGVRVEVVA